MKPGGTEGGTAPFLGGLGLVLLSVGLYLFFDSVHVTSAGPGLVSGWLFGATGWETTSRGIIFLPFLLAIVILFYDSKLAFGWILLWASLGVVAVEILSRIRFFFDMKTSHLLLLLAVIGAGTGLMIRGLRSPAQPDSTEAGKPPAGGRNDRSGQA
jgi:hypothetical protein